MKSKVLVKLTLACLLGASVYLPSCSKNNETYHYPVNPNAGAAATVMNVQLTGSASTSTFSKVNIDVKAMHFNTSAEYGIREGWETVNIEKPGSINILSLLNGKSLRMNADMLPGDTKQLRVLFGENNSVEINGELRPLNVSNELKENGLIIYTSTDDNAYANSIWLNFDATQSVTYDAVTNEYTLVPAIYPFDESKTGSIEGFISPVDAMATIQLEADVNSRTQFVNVTSTAEQQNQGYFKLVGIPEGNYRVVIVAGDGTDRKKTIDNVEVKLKETNSIGSVAFE